MNMQGTLVDGTITYALVDGDLWMKMEFSGQVFEEIFMENVCYQTYPPGAVTW
jgi:hypothetical protein